MTTYLGLVLAGAIGAPLRYLVDLWVQRGDRFPLGTMLVNITGSLLLGIVTGLVLYHAFPTTPKAVLGAGFCGAYTTFSTYTFETAQLAEEGEWWAALASTAGNLLGATAAAALGLAAVAIT